MPMKVKMQGLPAYVEPETKTVVHIRPEDDPFDHNEEYKDIISAMSGIGTVEKKAESVKIPGVIGTVLPKGHYITLAKGSTIVYPPEPSMNVISSDGTKKLYIFKRAPTLDDLKIAAGVAKELFPESIKIKALAGRHKIDNIPGVEAEVYTCTTAVVVVCPKGKVPYSEIQIRKAVMVTTLRSLGTLVTSHFDLDLRVVDESIDIDTSKLLGVGF